MAEIENNIKDVRKKIENAAKKVSREILDIKLVCVSKNHPAEKIITAIDSGERCFGENKAQEFRDKYEVLEGKGIEWHFIGNLQKNKLKYIVGKAFMIHSVESTEMAIEINKKAEKMGMIQNILLEVNVSNELSKSGFDKREVFHAIKELFELKNLNLCGLMTMAPFTGDEFVIRNCFSGLKNIKDEISDTLPLERQKEFTNLSMGMSNDFEIAVEEGATIVRVGTDIFGSR